VKRIIVSLVSFLFVLSCTQSASARGRRPKRPPKRSKASIMSTYKNKVAVIDTSKGRIIIKFYPKEAPNTVQNFASLADQEFYDGLIFHRVIKGFMIQGGCPLGTGTGGPGWQIDAEFSAIKHEPGTVSMARSQDPNSAGSQFFICLERTPHLDGKYTAFGQVIKGMDVVKAIGDVKTDAKDRPVDEVKIFKVRIMSKDDAEKLGAE